MWRVGGGDVGDGAGGLAHADADAHGTLLVGIQQGAVLVGRPAAHGSAGVHVLADGVLLKALGGNDGHVPLRYLLLGDDPPDAAEVVHVGVADNDTHNGVLPQLLVHQSLGGLGALHRHEGIKDDPAGIALDESDVGHVVAPDLVDAVGDLEQAVDVVELGIAPQAGVDSVGGVGILQEGIGVLTPDHLAALVLQLQGFGGANEAPLGKLQLPLVIKVQLVVDRLVALGGDLAGPLLLRRQGGALLLRRRAAKGESCQQRADHTQNHNPFLHILNFPSHGSGPIGVLYAVNHILASLRQLVNTTKV